MRPGQSPYEALTQRIHADAQWLGIRLDTYDPDALLGTIFAFLDEHDAVLTPHGVEKADRYFADGSP